MARTRNTTKTTVTRTDVPRQRKSRLKTDFSYLESQYPDKAFRLFNNEEGRVHQAMQEGWIPVEGESMNGVVSFDGTVKREKNSVIQIPVGPGKTESAMNGVLMMIDKELFAEYEAEKRAKLDDQERALKGGAGNVSPGESGGPIETYAPNLPTGGVGFETN